MFEEHHMQHVLESCVKSPELLPRKRPEDSAKEIR